ncbi:MAG TPA: diaminopimelate epimerase, partial [Methylovirgula sp.]
MHPLAGRKAIKMNGLGNEIVILDLRGASYAVSAADVRAIDHDPRLSFDQLMVLEDPRRLGTETFVRIFNNDGSEAGACGNGTRCVAWFLMHNTPLGELSLETLGGVLRCWRRGEWQFAVDMGRPRFAWNEIPLSKAVADTNAIPFSVAKGAPLVASAVNVGNPHAVFFIEDLRAYDLAAIGPVLETDPLFPERANISFAQILAPDRIVAQVWERGAGLTLACGSAACAILVAGARRGLSARSATVTLPGGDLLLTWAGDDHVVMEGPVEWEFESTLDA